jgi:predicted ATP-binding protein involved in virulence
MRQITFDHFRCFDHLRLEFTEHVNLLIGDNGSGKTTIVRGISTALNAFFTGFSDANTRFTGLEKNDFKVDQANGIIANEEPVKISFNWLDTENTLELRTAKSKTLKAPLKPITELGKKLYKELVKGGIQQAPLPLITSFSTSDIHKPRRFSPDIFKKYDHKPSFGYFECFQGDGFMKYWTLRLLTLKEANLGQLEIDGVLNALKDALGPDGCNVIDHAEIRPIKGDVYYHLSDGRVTDTDNLSDGLRRLVNIVMDMSFRCMLLNKGIYGLDACTMSSGTVLIDEIDLHLHPVLQSKVLNALKRAFPRIQFIVTSHAPLIMSGIPNDPQNSVIKLSYEAPRGYMAQNINAYGLDASTILQIVMGISPRSQKVEDDLKIMFSLIDQDRFTEAFNKLGELRHRFGDNLPELARAEAMLNILMEPVDGAD